MVTTKMNWSGPNVIHFGRKSQFGPYQFIFVVTISFWPRPNHYGQAQINLDRPKPFWTNQNCFGHIEGQGIKNCPVLFLYPAGDSEIVIISITNNICYFQKTIIILQNYSEFHKTGLKFKKTYSVQ